MCAFVISPGESPLASPNDSALAYEIRKDERTFGVRLEEAYPDTVGAVAFSHEKVSSVNTVSVGFKYRYFRNLSSESVSSKPPTESTLSDLIKNSVARQLQIKVPQVIRRLF